jgi:hypothetical protein
MENTNLKSEQKESSAAWASDKGSSTEALDGAAEQNPVEQRTSETPLTGEEHLSSCSQTSENLDRLAEKVSTLGLRVARKNHCGVARKRARKARLVAAPTGASDSGRPRSAAGEQPLNSQKPGTSGAQHGRGPASSAQKSPECGRHPQGPGK